MEYGVENEKQKEMMEAFERALLDKPVEEQMAAALAASNILNGASWAFCGMDPVLREQEETFAQSSTCSLQRVTYNRQMGIQGYLVYMKLDRLCELLGPDSKGPLTAEEIALVRKENTDAKKELIDRIASGYAGKIGIYYTGNSGTVTVSGRTFPAYAVTLKELCEICERLNYGIVIGGVTREPGEVSRREDAVLEHLMLTPGNNALFIDIAHRQK